MTKKENAYLRFIVEHINREIREVYNGTSLEDHFESENEKAAFIQGLSYAIDPLATFIKMEVAAVDLNRLTSR